jgi:hypothetical protein
VDIVDFTWLFGTTALAHGLQSVTQQFAMACN